MAKHLVLLALAALLAVSSAASNPFLGADFFVDPDYYNEVQTSINSASTPTVASLLRKAQSVSTFHWIDRIAKVGNVTAILKLAAAQQQQTGRPVVASFVIYDLPDRDCAAAASNGELSVNDDGLNKYKTLYIDPIAQQLAAYPNVRVALVIEPDSLPNLATNLGVQKCQEAKQAYMDGVAYAISTFGALSNVAMYIDSAHEAWLGWPNNRQLIVGIFQQVLTAAGGADKIRGFSVNVANYFPFQRYSNDTICDSSDPCTDEQSYIQALNTDLTNAGIGGKGFLVDTSRNGQHSIRHDCGNWCNIKGAGLGPRPQASPAPLVDAYAWVKVPGESDGTSDGGAPRYDWHCSSSDSYQPAPQAGLWFNDFFVMLAQNANPPL